MTCAGFGKVFAVLVLVGAPCAAVQDRTNANAKERVLEASLFKSWDAILEGQTLPTAPPGKISPKRSPIQRVVALLQEMKAQLEKEADEDEEIYDKMVCWCETNEKEKTKAIADADQKITDLVALIEEKAARSAELETQIEQLKKEIGEESEAMDAATAMREKEGAEFMQEEKDLVQAIANLKNAILVLSKHHEGLLQLTPEMVQSMSTVLRYAALKHEMLMGDHADRAKHKEQHDALRTALIALNEETKKRSAGKSETEAEAQEGAFLRKLHVSLNVYDRASPDRIPLKYAGRVLEDLVQKSSSMGKANVPPRKVDAYTPQSGVIFGILKQMKEEFEGNLAQAQKDEEQATGDYSDLKGTKGEQIAAAKELVKDKQAELGDTKNALADAKEDLTDTREQQKNDKEFLMKLKLICQDLDKQWERRSKTRSDELKAVSETIAILTEDDNADLMRKTVTLVQLSSTTHTLSKAQLLRRSVARVLRRLPSFDDDDLEAEWKGRNGPQRQLATLALSVELDAFTKVKAAMDGMIAELKAQMEEEVKIKVHCTDEFNTNEKQTYEKTREKTELERKIEALTATIEQLTAEIADANEQIATMILEIKKAGQNREAENTEYQTSVAEQRATQEILKKAKARMELFYKKKALVQESKEDPVPPVAFKAYKKNSGGSGIIEFLDMIVEDSKKVETDAIADEAAAQKAYETFVNDSNASIKGLTEEIVTKTEQKATAEMEKESSITAKKNAENALEQLAAYVADLHAECDFIVKNFDTRQKARLQEIEAIHEAKAILSGAMSSGVAEGE